MSEENTYKKAKLGLPENADIDLEKRGIISNKKKKKQYILESKLGQGTYAIVYSARRKKDNARVAIKKIKDSSLDSGFDPSTVREIKTLKELNHPNILKLYDVFMKKEKLHLVLEFLVTDLELLIKQRNTFFSMADIKAWMLMAIRGIDFCHENFIIHRVYNGILKIADFGLARDFGEHYAMTSEVVTRWYRAPELLIHARHYSAAVDMWSLGCIFAELMIRSPFIPGESDMAQMGTICKALGTPTEADWPGLNLLLGSIQLPKHEKPALQGLFPAADEVTMDFLIRLLKYDPNKRLTSKQALEHFYFSEDPIPTPYWELPKPNDKNNFSKAVGEAYDSSGSGSGSSSDED